MSRHFKICPRLRDAALPSLRERVYGCHGCRVCCHSMHSTHGMYGLPPHAQFVPIETTGTFSYQENIYFFLFGTKDRVERDC